MKIFKEASHREVSNMTAICEELKDRMADLSENWNEIDELLSELREYEYDGMNDVCEKGYGIMEDYKNLVERKFDGFWEDRAVSAKLCNHFLDTGNGSNPSSFRNALCFAVDS